VCMGVLKGLYQFAQASDSEFKDWAPDSAFSYAYDTLDRWRKGGTKKETVNALRAFIEAELPAWKDSLRRLVRLRKDERSSYIFRNSPGLSGDDDYGCGLVPFTGTYFPHDSRSTLHGSELPVSKSDAC